MASDRADRLALYLDEAEADSRFWERSHCLLFLARWAAQERAEFGLGPYLGRCSGPISAARILKLEGGIDAFVSREAERNDLRPVEAAAARLGSIGLIRVQRERKPGFLTFGCIRTPQSWAIRASDGLVRLHAETIRVQPHLVWEI
ncbi:DUF6950 family protein [Hansschlegelia plantiphila]|uniref:DUF6950 domain-containing protein n=1 Tax=Hansschlegelia plantiphila TaxID=374655 RepID=A0A9W6MUN2_9HYPH|nr:hypothetical protein [Hansschlegelia plantiphila]GLK67001.1 hypothetical protein GCM10008179_06390 [Hansschlegelia plantiphila]